MTRAAALGRVAVANRFDPEWSPLQMTSVRLWVDGDTSLALGTWTDLSGNANNLVQPTAGSRGTIVASAINGHTSLLLDGVDDFYTATFTLAQPVTVISLHRHVALGVGASHDIVLDGVTAGNMTLRATTAPQYEFSSGGAGPTSAMTVANGQYAITTLRLNGASSFIRVNGTQIAAAAAGSGGAGGLSLGYVVGARSANAEFQTVMVSAAALSTDEIIHAEQYLMLKAGWI